MCVLSFERRTLLTFRSQKELATDRKVTACTVRHDVVNTDVRDDAVNTSTTVSDVRRNALKSSRDTRGQDLRVSTIRPLLVTK